MKTLPALLLASLSLAACASLAPPSAEEMATLPVVTYGQPAPAGQAFILHYPAGTSLPVTAAVSGSLLAREARTDLQVSLKRDIYTYQTWASFDGKTWAPGHDLVSGRIAMALPGESDGRSPGSLTAEFNLK